MMTRQMAIQVVEDLHPARAIVRHRRVLERSQLVMRIRRLTCLPRRSRRCLLLEIKYQHGCFHVLHFNNAFAFCLLSLDNYLCFGFFFFPFVDVLSWFRTAFLL